MGVMVVMEKMLSVAMNPASLPVHVAAFTGRRAFSAAPAVGEGDLWCGYGHGGQNYERESEHTRTPPSGVAPIIDAQTRLDRGQTDLSRVLDAGASIGQTQAERGFPDLPDDYRRLSYSAVRAGYRLDVAVLKADAALARQNARTTHCADWYDQLQAGL